jgi:ubiquinone/menaquinone biosynthesis C-methylase UbiE
VGAPEVGANDAKQSSIWPASNYCIFARYFEPGAMKFLARLEITPGLHMLDVACGMGKLALPAARAGAHVTAVDTAGSLITDAIARATAEDLPVRFDEGDIDELPYEDESFDLVTSLIDAMFAPHPQRVAEEMVRVCRPGGSIVTGHWTPHGAMGKMLAILARYAPLPRGVSPPTLWGG